MSKVTCNFVTFGLGIGFALIGVTLVIYGHVYFGRFYQNMLKLSPDSTAYRLWVHTPLPLYLEVYLFNWTNANEFLRDKSVIPQFEEVGPFTFRESHDRVNLIWNNDNTVSYNQSRKWNFVPEESEDLSLEITNLNVITVTLSQMVRSLSKMKWVLNFLFDRNANLVTTSSAKNWLFDGIEDKLLDDLLLIEKILHIPPAIKKFGWFYNRNMSTSYDGIFTIKTGADDLYNVGMMASWNRMNHTKYFERECGMVNGTTGELFPPMEKVDDDLNIFVSDLCSSISLKYNRPSIVEGIKSAKYVGTEETFDNGQSNPNNKCFCNGECSPYGVRNVTSCRGPPLFFSFPHFYLADNSYKNAVFGMMPNESEHEFSISLDPTTGIPTDVRAQLQINLLLQPVSWLNKFKNVPKIYFPMMWFRQRATITPELAFDALLIKLLPVAMFGFFYGLILTGLIIISVRLFIICYCRRSDKHGLLLPVIVNDDDENCLLNS